MKQEINCPYCKKMFRYDDQTKDGSMFAFALILGVLIGGVMVLLFGW